MPARKRSRKGDRPSRVPRRHVPGPGEARGGGLTFGAAARVAHAVARFKGGVFTDPITLGTLARSRGVLLNKQMYDPVALRKALLEHGLSRVPHSRRPLTPADRAAIEYAAAAADVSVRNTCLAGHQ